MITSFPSFQLLLKLLALFLLCYLPGLSISALLKRPKSWFDYGPLPFSLGLIFNCIIILILTLTHLYSPLSWIGTTIFLTTTIILPILIYFRSNSIVHEKKPSWKFQLSQGIIILSCLVFFRTPSQWVLHYGMDASNYITQAAHQISQGTPFLENFYADQYQNDFPKAEFQINSFGGKINKEGKREFFFPPLWKQALSIFLYFGGYKLALLLPATLVCLTLFAWSEWAFVAVQSEFLAILTTALLGLSPVLIQYMKIPMSEPFFLFIVMYGMLLLQRGLNLLSLSYAVIAGICVGLTFLIKVDAILLLPGFWLASYILIYHEKIDPKKLKIIHWFLISLLFTATITWQASLFLTRYYIAISFNDFIVNTISYGLPCLLGLTYIFNQLPYPKQRVFFERISLFFRHRIFKLILLSTVLLFALLLLVREESILPLIKSRWPARIERIETFFFPTNVAFRYLTLPLTVTGIVSVFYFVVRTQLTALAWLSPFALISLIAVGDLAHSNYHYWASRRYITSLLPLFCIAILFFGNELRTRNYLKQTWIRDSFYIWMTIIAIAYGVNNFFINIIHGDWENLATEVKPISTLYLPSDIVIFDANQRLSDALQLYLKYTLGIESLALDFNHVTDSELVKFFQKIDQSKHRLIVDNLTSDVYRRLNKIFLINNLEKKYTLNCLQTILLNPNVIKQVQ